MSLEYSTHTKFVSSTLEPNMSFVAVAQSLSHVRLFATPWTAACQALLAFTMSWGGCSNSLNSSLKPVH